MSKSPSIPEELIRIKAHEIGKKRQHQVRDGTPETDWEEAVDYLEKHRWEVFRWKVKHPDDRDFALDVVKTFISAFALVATFIAVVGLFLTYHIAEKDRQEAREDRKVAQNQLNVAQNQLNTVQERLVTERFSKAVEQLGKYKDRQGQNRDITVRIGGIYALERIAKDSPKDYWTIMEVLISYVREYSPLPKKLTKNRLEKLKWNEKERELAKLKEEEMRIDVQAALTVIGRSEDPEPDREERIDLSFTNLFKAVLGNADLKKAKLYRANLQEAKLYNANLEGADFWSANLYQANLNGAILKKTNLGAANLQGADLSKANLEGALIEKVPVENLKNPTDQEIQKIKQAIKDLEKVGTYTVKNVKDLTPKQIEEIEEIEQFKSAHSWDQAIYIGRWDVDKELVEPHEAHNKDYIEKLRKIIESDKFAKLWEKVRETRVNDLQGVKYP